MKTLSRDDGGPRAKAKSKAPGWSVFERVDPKSGRVTFVVKYKDDAEEWRSKRVPAAFSKNKREAEAWAREWYESGGYREKAADADPTVGDFLDTALNDQSPELRDSTRRNKKGHVGQHLKPALGGIQLRELSPERIARFVRELRDEPRRDADGNGVPPPASFTIRNIVATLRDLLDDAVDRRIIPSNPARSKLVRKQVPAAQTRAVQRAGQETVIFLPQAEAETLVRCAAVPFDRRVRYLLGLMTGLRDGEIAALSWRDVALDAAVPHLDVRASLSLARKVTPPKTRHGRRRVPLAPLVVEVLTEWKEVVLSAEPEAPLFPGPSGRHYRPGSADLFRNDLATAKLAEHQAGEPFTFHALRRSFATWLQKAGVDAGHRKRLMGHGGGGVTDGSYTAKELVELAKAVAALPLSVTLAEMLAPPAQTVGLGADLGAEPHQNDEPRTASSGLYVRVSPFVGASSGPDIMLNATLWSMSLAGALDLEVRTGFEPAYNGFANRCLTAWLPHRDVRFLRVGLALGSLGRRILLTDGRRSTRHWTVTVLAQSRGLHWRLRLGSPCLQTS